jgi:hypothetical protein
MLRPVSFGDQRMTDQFPGSEDPGLGAALAQADPSLARMYEYWRARRGNRLLPLHGDIDPVDFAKYLQSVMLVDVVSGAAGEPDFVYRLVGTREVAERGQDPTGERVAIAYRGPSAEDALHCYRTVVETRRPHVDLTPFSIAGRYTRDVGNIFLPFSADGRRVTRILVYTVFERERAVHEPMGQPSLPQWAEPTGT